MIPRPPLLPRAVPAARLATLAGLSGFVHSMILRAAGRIMTTLHVGAFGLRLLGKSLRRTRGTPGSERLTVQPWQLLEGGGCELPPLEDEPLEAFRAMLVSLDLEDNALPPAS